MAADSAGPSSTPSSATTTASWNGSTSTAGDDLGTVGRSAQAGA
jgi:hypothetical protein